MPKSDKIKQTKRKIQQLEKTLTGNNSAQLTQEVTYQIKGTNRTAVRLFVPKLRKVCHHHPMAVTLCQNDGNYYLSFKYPDYGKTTNQIHQKLYHHIALWLGDWCDFKIKPSDNVLSKDTHNIFKYDSIPEINESMQNYNERDLWVDLIQNHAKSFNFWNLSIPKIGDFKDLKAIIKVLESFEKQSSLVKQWHEDNKGKKKVKKSLKLLAKLRKLSKAAFPAAWTLASSDTYACNDITQITRIFMAIRAVRTSPNWLSTKDRYYMYPFQGLSNRRILDLDIEAIKVVKLLHPKLLGTVKDQKPIAQYMFLGYNSYGTYSTNPKDLCSAMDIVDPGLNARQDKNLALKIQSKLHSLSGYRHVTIEPISHNPNLFAFHNGIYDRVTKQLLHFSPKRVITAKMQTNYDPKWKKYYKLAEPLYHIKKLPMSMRKCHLHKLLKRYANGNYARYISLKQAALATFSTQYGYDKAFLFLGAGGTGKSSCLQMLKLVLGNQNYSSLQYEKIDKPYYAGDLQGSIANISDETNSDQYLFNTSNFKSIVTHENFTVNNKFEKPYDIQMKNITMLQAGNRGLRIKDDNGAISRRLITIKFNNTHIKDHQDVNIKDGLLKNKYFASWFAYTIVNTVPPISKFIVSKEDRKLTTREMYRSDPVLIFIKNKVRPTLSKYHDSLRQIMKNYLYRWYINVAKNSGIHPEKEIKFLTDFKDDLNKVYTSKGIAPPLVEDRCAVAKSSAATLKNIADNDPSSEMPVTKPTNEGFRIKANDPRYFDIMGYVNKTERMYVINNHFTWKDDYKDSIEAISRVPEDFYIFKDWLYAREMKYMIRASGENGRIFNGMNIAGASYDVETTMSVLKKLQNNHPDGLTLRKHLKNRLSNWRVIFNAIRDFGKRRFKGLPF